MQAQLLAGQLSEWSRNSDKQLHRLASYLNTKPLFEYSSPRPGVHVGSLLWRWSGGLPPAKSPSGLFLVEAQMASLLPWRGAIPGNRAMLPEVPRMRNSTP